MTSNICDITCWVKWKPTKWSQNKNYSFVNSKQGILGKGVWSKINGEGGKGNCVTLCKFLALKCETLGDKWIRQVT
jgi:hypothetical protein